MKRKQKPPRPTIGWCVVDTGGFLYLLSLAWQKNNSIVHFTRNHSTPWPDFHKRG